MDCNRKYSSCRQLSRDPIFIVNACHSLTTIILVFRYLILRSILITVIILWWLCDVLRPLRDDHDVWRKWTARQSAFFPTVCRVECCIIFSFDLLFYRNIPLGTTLPKATLESISFRLKYAHWVIFSIFFSVKHKQNQTVRAPSLVVCVQLFDGCWFFGNCTVLIHILHKLLRFSIGLHAVSSRKWIRRFCSDVWKTFEEFPKITTKSHLLSNILIKIQSMIGAMVLAKIVRKTSGAGLKRHTSWKIPIASLRNLK